MKGDLSIIMYSWVAAEKFFLRWAVWLYQYTCLKLQLCAGCVLLACYPISDLHLSLDTHACTHTCTDAHTHACTHTCTHTCMHACRMHACMHALTHAHTHARTHAHTHARMHTRTYAAHAHVRIHTVMHTCTHTDLHSLINSEIIALFHLSYWYSKFACYRTDVVEFGSFQTCQERFVRERSISETGVVKFLYSNIFKEYLSVSLVWYWLSHHTNNEVRSENYTIFYLNTPGRLRGRTYVNKWAVCVWCMFMQPRLVITFWIQWHYVFDCLQASLSLEHSMSIKPTALHGHSGAQYTARV